MADNRQAHHRFTVYRSGIPGWSWRVEGPDCATKEEAEALCTLANAAENLLDVLRTIKDESCPDSEAHRQASAALAACEVRT